MHYFFHSSNTDAELFGTTRDVQTMCTLSPDQYKGTFSTTDFSLVQKYCVTLKNIVPCEPPTQSAVGAAPLKMYRALCTVHQCKGQHHLQCIHSLCCYCLSFIQPDARPDVPLVMYGIDVVLSLKTTDIEKWWRWPLVSEKNGLLEVHKAPPPWCTRCPHIMHIGHMYPSVSAVGEGY